MPHLLCCCGGRQPETMEDQVARSMSGHATSKRRPRFSYLEYEKAKNAKSDASSSHADWSEAYAFQNLGSDATNGSDTSKGVFRGNPLYRHDPPPLLSYDANGNSGATHGQPATDGATATAIVADEGSDGKLNGFDDEGSDGKLNGFDDEESFEGFGDNVSGDFDDDESEPDATQQAGAAQSSSPPPAAAAAKAAAATPSTPRGRGPFENRRETAQSSTSVDSAHFAGLPVASVGNLPPPAPLEVTTPRPTTPKSGRTSPFSETRSMRGAPSPMAMPTPEGRIAGEGIESVVFAAALPQIRVRPSKRSRSATSFTDFVFSAAHVNRRMLEAYMLSVDDYDQIDGLAVRELLDTASSSFAAIDTASSGEVTLAGVLGATPDVDQNDPYAVDEVKTAFCAADDDHTGTLRYRQYANFMLLREGHIATPLVDPTEPVLMADGSLRVPDGMQYGSAAVLRELSSTQPGLFRKQPRGEVQIMASAEPIAAGYYRTHVVVQGAVRLVAPACWIDMSVVTHGRRQHHVSVKFAPAQHPRHEQDVTWQIPRADAADNATVVVRYYGKSRSDPPLGVLTIPVLDIASDDVTTDGWFHLLPESSSSSLLALSSALATPTVVPYFRCNDPPGPSKAAIELPPNQVEAMSRRDRSERLMPPHSLLDVKVSRVLGAGTYGKVVLAVDSLGNEFAIKAMSKADAIQKDEVEQVMTERLILSRFRHTFVARLFSSFDTDAFLYLCLEPLLGGSLESVAKEGKPLSAKAVAFYGGEILLGLWYLHDCGVIYRDLKLENVLLDSAGHLRLADFGLAKVLPEGTLETHTFCGTPEYVAPEMLSGGSYGRSVDCWSLGVLLYRLRVGSFPYPRRHNDDAEAVYDALRNNKRVAMPPFMDKKCATAIAGFLTLDHKTRLGCDLQRGAEDIRATPLFSRTNWVQLARRGKKPPISVSAAVAKQGRTVANPQSGEAIFSLGGAQRPVTDDDQARFEGFGWSLDHERDAALGLPPAL
eukprot:m.130646 g.130646  ORF g.130646 m.130646 type:complete len:994 (+) comp11288_c0_seq6:213-3194(+)